MHTYIQRIRTDHLVHWYELFHYTQAMLPHPPIEKKPIGKKDIVPCLFMLERKQLRQFAIPYPPHRNLCARIFTTLPNTNTQSKILVAVTYAEWTLVLEDRVQWTRGVQQPMVEEEGGNVNRSWRGQSRTWDQEEAQQKGSAKKKTKKQGEKGNLSRSRRPIRREPGRRRKVEKR